MHLAAELGAELKALQWQVTAAESCTGGGIAAAITAVAGSSAWFEVGFVTYANRTKTSLLGVPEATLEAHGAVSEPVVLAMVEGALAASGADLAVAVSGIAGPDGGSREKPVGTVWLAWGRADGWRRARCFYFDGDRASVRRQAVVVALRELVDICQHGGRAYEPPEVGRG
nr:nicotinamide-nucleotide amidohydrolase family protein [Marinimicrobium alkaliphilum]